MLSELHQRLSETYRLEQSHDVRDYVITDPKLATVIGQDALLSGSDETLFIAEDDDGLALSLFLDGDMLDRLQVADPLSELKPGCLDDLWKVLEGISHFSCMAFKAERDRKVSLLELELQGEVDKFLSAMLLAADQENDALQKDLHGWLFESTRLKDDLDAEERERYTAANRYAARFCHRLRAEWQQLGTLPIDELRRFFRLQLPDKISHIHARA